MAGVNISALRSGMQQVMAVRTAKSFVRGEFNNALITLRPHAVVLDSCIPAHGSTVDQIDRFLAGSRAIPKRDEVEALSGTIEKKIALLDEIGLGSTSAPRDPAASGSPVGRRSKPRYGIYTPQNKVITRRDYQSLVIQEFQKHISTKGENGKLPKRGIARVDTGLGKTPLYGWMSKSLRESRPREYGNAVTVILSIREKVGRDMSQTISTVMGEDVVYLTNKTKPQDLEGRRNCYLNYAQMSQDEAYEKIKGWAGDRPIIFIDDEADLCVPKVNEKGEMSDLAWFSFLVKFGLFTVEPDDENFYVNFNEKTPHFLLGATATLDRPDRYPLASVFGPSPFYHRPMLSGIQDRYLTRLKGGVIQMEIPEGADRKDFRELTRIEGGQVICDNIRIRQAAQTDYAIKASVRGALDNMLLMLDGRRAKDKPGVVHMDDGSYQRTVQGCGYAVDVPTMLKHMEWQQDLFDLLEVVYHAREGRKQPGKPITRGQLLKLIREYLKVDVDLSGKSDSEIIDLLSETLTRLLNKREGDAIRQEIGATVGEVMSHLKSGRMDGVTELFDNLYSILNGDVRRVKGRRLKASAVWGEMDDPVAVDEKRQHINRIGGRDATFDALARDEVDMLWSVDMLKRGFDSPRLGFAIDNAPTRSRRDLVQRIGRIVRPWNPMDPTDHTMKPFARYFTVTTNLDEHMVDLTIQDVARVFGKEFSPLRTTVMVGPRGGDTTYDLPDVSQLDTVTIRGRAIVRVGKKLAKALCDALKAGDPQFALLDKEALAYAAKGRKRLGKFHARTIDELLKGIYMVYDWELEELMTAWKITDPGTRADIMDARIQDRAAASVAYGSMFRETGGMI